MYLPGCLPAYYLIYLPTYLPSCSPTNYEVKYGCLHMPCRVCCVGNHEDSYPHEDEHEGNIQCARRLLEKIKDKALLIDICQRYLQVPNIIWVDMYFLHLNYDADVL